MSETQAQSGVEELLLRLAGLAREERTVAALEDDALDVAAALDDEVAFARLRSRIKAMGVGLRDWSAAVKARREARADAAPPSRRTSPSTSSSRAERLERPTILITEHEHDVAEQAIAALATDTGVYQRHGALVRLVEHTRCAPGDAEPTRHRAIEPLTLPILRAKLARVAAWRELRMREGDLCEGPAHPPEWAVKSVADWRAWPGIRPLYHVSPIPVALHDGEVLQTPGYDAARGIIYDPSVDVPPVPESPTQEDAAGACAMLLELVAEVPFEEPVHRAAWLAALLTPIARWAFEGCAPANLITANQAGSGKGLLAQIIGGIVVGGSLDLMPPTQDEDEERKRITSKVIAGDLCVLIDNWPSEWLFGSPNLEALTTTTVWSDRLFHQQNAPSWPAYMTWYITGNNVAFAREDMARRTCVIRILSDERPEERTGYKIPDMRAHVRQHRGELLRACLTMIRAWLLMRMPARALDGWGGTWGSFDGWDQVVRGAIVFAGQPDPIGAKGTRAAIELQDPGLPDLIEGLIEAIGQVGQPRSDGGDGKSTLAKDLLDGLVENDEFRRGDKTTPLRWAKLRSGIEQMVRGIRPGMLPNARQLGQLLGRVRGKFVPGKRLRLMGSKGEWWVEAVPEKAPELDVEREAIQAEGEST